jgi:alpha-glucosidase
MKNTADKVMLASPDGLLRAEMTIREGRLHWQLFRQGKPLTQPSLTGITVNKRDRSAGLVGLSLSHPTLIALPLTRRFFAPISRCQRIATTLTALGKDGPELLVDVRLFNDGIAYRYRLPGKGETSNRCHIAYEESSLVAIEGSVFWIQDSPVAMKNCEGAWEKKQIGEVHADRSGPVVITLPSKQGYLAMLEGGNYGLDWSGSKYQIVGPRIRHVFSHDDSGFWIENANFTSPWRIVTVATNLNELVQNPMLAALAPEPEKSLFADATRWVRPGRCAWSWWHDDKVDIATQTRFIDLAAEMGFEYNVIDGGWWESAKKGQTQWDLLTEICAYGRSRGVAQWVWTAQESTRNPANNWQQMRDEFDRFKATGVVGLKIDFVDSDAQAARRWYTAALRHAAERKLMLNFHGANIPTGEAQTYPNEMSREGIYGLEQNKWTTIPPQHYAALPFTRFLVGHGDFTPGYFGHDPNRLKGTSWSLQLATSIVYSNSLLHWSGIPEDLHAAFPSGSPERTVFTGVIANWDETHVLPGAEIGVLAPFARRTRNVWYVGVIGGASAQGYQFDCNFLKTGNWRAIMLTDIPDRPDAWSITKLSCTPTTVLRPTLRPLGGSVVRFEKIV